MLLEFDKDAILKIVSDFLKSNGMNGEVEFSCDDNAVVLVSIDNAPISNHKDDWSKADI